MSVISEAIAAELERTAQKIEVQAETASPVPPGDRFVARLKVPATMEVVLEPEGPLGPDVPAALPKTHTVQKGETLSAIARRHGTTVEKLAEINKLDDPNVIRPGQVLRLAREAEAGSTPTVVTVPIDAKVSWKIIRRDPAGDARAGRDFDLDAAGPDTRGDLHEFTANVLLAPPVVPMTRPPAKQAAEWLIEPDVTLTARPDKVSELDQLGERPQDFTPEDLESLPVTAGPLEVPTIVVAFSETEYNERSNKARLVIVPENVRVDQVEGRLRSAKDVKVLDALKDVRDVLDRLKGLGRLAELATGLKIGLDTIIETINAHPVGSKHKLVFKRLNEAKDLGKVEHDWRHRGPFVDDHGAEDDIDSLLMVSVDQRLELFEDQNFKDTKVEIEPSRSQLWIGILDFHDVKKAEPSDARVTSGVSNFSDEAHSLRFRRQS